MERQESPKEKAKRLAATQRLLDQVDFKKKRQEIRTASSTQHDIE
tara:strand:- start:383 stop:517 length:135 start_codon:yes stop_codon:yes gene_type:complete